MPRIRLVHIIGSLDVGGAERALVSLASQIDPRFTETRVISLLDRGPLHRLLTDQGIACETLGMNSRRPNPAAVFKLALRLRSLKPDAVITWLYGANLLGGAASVLAGRLPLVWNIRSGAVQPGTTSRGTWWAFRYGAYLSRWLPHHVAHVSHAGRRLHAKQGYAENKTLVIPNGFDTSLFRPDSQARATVRQELNLPADCPLVGLMGRFHPDKDHANFIRAAARIAEIRPDVRFLLCGNNVNGNNPRLVTWLRESCIEERCHLLGTRADMPRLMASLDVNISSSASEAFPQVVGEAMACGVPCVVTNVGDSAWAVGETGRVTPPRDDEALATACLELLSLKASDRQALGALARQRIQQDFSFGRMVEQHLNLWGEAAGRPILGRTIAAEPERKAA